MIDYNYTGKAHNMSQFLNSHVTMVIELERNFNNIKCEFFTFSTV